MTEEEHRPDGLDLARSLTRATAAAQSGTKASAPRRRPPTQRTTTDASGERFGSGREPQLVGGALSRLVDDQGWDLDLRIRGVFARWEELVGAEVASHSAPESFADGRLVVRCDSTAWATQLKLLVSPLVARLNAELGDGSVLVIEVLGPTGPSWKKGPRSVRGGRGPRDTYG